MKVTYLFSSYCARRQIGIFWATTGAAFILAWAGRAEAQQFSLTALGGISGASSYSAADINASGQVVGSAFVPSQDTNRAFLYGNGVTTDLGAFAAQTTAVGINDSGQIALNTHSPPGSFFFAGIYSNGSFTSITSPAAPYGINTSAGGINNGGQLTGSADAVINPGTSQSVGTHEAFLFGNDTNILLGTLGGAASQGNAINASGAIAGGSDTADGAQHAFLYGNGTMSDLGTLGGKNSIGTALTSNGEVTGQADLLGGATSHAFLYQSGKMIDLGTLGGANSEGFGINNIGQITGEADILGSSATHAFLYSNGKMIDLNSLISGDASSLYTLTSAVSINDSGQIAVNGFIDATGQDAAFLLTPVPLPGAMGQLLMGLAALALYSRRRSTAQR